MVCINLPLPLPFRRVKYFQLGCWGLLLVGPGEDSDEVEYSLGPRMSAALGTCAFGLGWGDTGLIRLRGRVAAERKPVVWHLRKPLICRLQAPRLYRPLPGGLKCDGSVLLVLPSGSGPLQDAFGGVGRLLQFADCDIRPAEMHSDG